MSSFHTTPDLTVNAGSQKSRTDTIGDRGLDPALAPKVVAKAHAAGLRVSAHVDTERDVRIALSGGVDELAHLPGYAIGPGEDFRRYELTEADAETTWPA